MAHSGFISDPEYTRRSQDESVTGKWVFKDVTTFEKVIRGTAIATYYADLAEYYEHSSIESLPTGTLVKFGGEKEITIANTNVNAVITSEPGFILNTQMENGQAIALCGRVPVRVIGKCKKFDYLTLSNIAGVATKLTNNYCFTIDGLSLKDEEIETLNFEKMPNIIARALEDKDTEEESLILCVVKFEL